MADTRRRVIEAPARKKPAVKLETIRVVVELLRVHGHPLAVAGVLLHDCVRSTLMVLAMETVAERRVRKPITDLIEELKNSPQALERQAAPTIAVATSSGLIIEVRGKEHFIIHKASGLPIGAGFKTATAANRALKLIAPITDWRRPLDDLDQTGLIEASRVLASLWRS
jgi:hypothetical protein